MQTPFRPDTPLGVYLIGLYAKSADPAETPQHAASDQGLHCLLTGSFMQNNIENLHHETLN